MSTLNQIANWKSANNPLEHVCGWDSISPTIIARGMDDNAQMVLYSPELKDTTNVRDKYMKQVEPCAYDEQNGYLRNDGTVGSLTTDGSSPKHNNRIVEPIDCRVRKLTERECFRLQGVKDEDFERVRANQSKSSCYHLAGDSITVSVLMALFGEMLDIDWRASVDELVDTLCSYDK